MPQLVDWMNMLWALYASINGLTEHVISCEWRKEEGWLTNIITGNVYANYMSEGGDMSNTITEHYKQL